jgi:AraC-like DNA-binding protein
VLARATQRVVAAKVCDAPSPPACGRAGEGGGDGGPANPWCIASRATIANLSPFHLCHVLRELVGTSIYEYVLRERLARAFYDVLEGGDDITAIALDTGFSSRSHLTAPFRRFFGCTPSELRRAIGPGEAGQLRKIMTAVRGDLA